MMIILSVILAIIVVVVWIAVGAFVSGLIDEAGRDGGFIAICCIGWPVILVFLGLFMLVSLLEYYTGKIHDYAAYTKKRIMGQFHKEE